MTRPPPSGRGRAWYRGDCHVHSKVSLDFVAVTEHDSVDTQTTWAALSGQDLLVILGQEATTPLGHWLALGLERGQVVHRQPDLGRVQVRGR